MSPSAKNKLFTGLVLLLLAANLVTIGLFWLNRTRQPQGPKESPKEFLARELKLDEKQKEQFEVLVKEHRGGVDALREKMKAAKDSFFDLIKEPVVSDSMRQAAASATSKITEEIDLLTLEHFRKVRALCTPEQQKKFDAIIHEVTRMMAGPRPPMGPDHPHEPPPPQ